MIKNKSKNQTIRLLVAVILVLTLTAVLFAGCTKEVSTKDAGNNTFSSNEDIKSVDDKDSQQNSLNTQNLSKTEVQDSNVKNSMNKSKNILSETDSEIVFKDKLEHEVLLKKKPQKVVSLMTSYTDLWYYVGGEVIGTVSTSSSPLPKSEKLIEDLGSFNKVSSEVLIALKPDLVILSSATQSQVALNDILTENNIPHIYIEYNYYNEFIEIVDLMARLTGTEDRILPKLDAITESVNSTIAKAREHEPKKVLIVFSSSKSVTVEMPNGLTGSMVEEFGADNIIEDTKIEGETRCDLSMETIIAKDPDIILIKTMGDIDACKETIKKELETNEAWMSLRAVKESKIIYLEKDLFMYKPNDRFPEAYEKLYQYIYDDNK